MKGRIGIIALLALSGATSLIGRSAAYLAGSDRLYTYYPSEFKNSNFKKKLVKKAIQKCKTSKKAEVLIEKMTAPLELSQAKQRRMSGKQRRLHMKARLARLEKIIKKMKRSQKKRSKELKRLKAKMKRTIPRSRSWR